MKRNPAPLPVQPSIERLPIALRAYVPAGARHAKSAGQDLGPSPYCIVLDTETTTGTEQELRFGVYQVWKGQNLWERGFFVNPATLRRGEIRTLRKFAENH